MPQATPYLQPVQQVTFAAIDFESAGAEKGHTDSPVQLGMAVLHPGAETPTDFFRSFLHNDQPITWSAQKVHGISTADLAGAPPLLSLWPQVRGTLANRVVVAHGAGTEKRFLRTYPMHGFGPWVDSLTLSQAVWPDLPKYSLGELGNALELTKTAQQLCPNLGYHDALFDSVVSLLLVKAAIDHAGLHNAPLDFLVKPNRNAYFARRRR